ncbi:MAG: THUMP domain-containing class I SAM-dependent RNA methyltransferase [Eubacteriales bacterium]
MKKIDIIATCTFGLESILKEELIKLGYCNMITQNGKIEFKGSIFDVARCNLWLRTADRVLIKIGNFTAVTFDELFEKTKACSWEEWISKKAQFPIAKATSVKSTLFSKSDCQSIVKKAIVEKLKNKYKVQWFDETEEQVPVFVSILKDQVTLSIDTTGIGLHKRGYRIKSNEAPLKETLAAALVYLSKWEISRPFADPFCGSGTIVIEAAMIGKNLAPGLNRNFISEQWNESIKAYEKAREEAQTQINQERFRLLGSDMDKRAVVLSKDNARQAGVEDVVAFQKLNVEDFGSGNKYGVIITNPPYGERLLSKREVENLYRVMGKVFSGLDYWSYFILTGHLNFEQYFGKKATKNRKLYNGNILTYLYQYYGKLPY